MGRLMNVVAAKGSDHMDLSNHFVNHILNEAFPPSTDRGWLICCNIFIRPLHFTLKMFLKNQQLLKMTFLKKYEINIGYSLGKFLQKCNTKYLRNYYIKCIYYL